MILKNKYLIGTLVQYYEIEMFKEHCESLAQMLMGIENKENVTFDFCFNFQQNFEKIDWEKFYEKYGNERGFTNYFNGVNEYLEVFNQSWGNIIPYNANIRIAVKTDLEDFYNIAAYRRELAYNGCLEADYVIFGETDSLFAKQTLFAIESLHDAVSSQYPKFVANFAGRKNWDASWNKIVHPLFQKVQYEETDEWIFSNEASEKSYMSLERMNEINNISNDQIQVISLTEPKADGSCLVFSSELLKSGVTLPQSIIHCGEDEAILQMAKKVMGDEFIQFNFNNLLRVHNRRHPHKRSFILNEDNPKGLCTAADKGDWWVDLETKSKYNLARLFKQEKFIQLNLGKSEI